MSQTRPQYSAFLKAKVALAALRKDVPITAVAWSRKSQLPPSQRRRKRAGSKTTVMISGDFRTALMNARNARQHSRTKRQGMETNVRLPRLWRGCRCLDDFRRGLPAIGSLFPNKGGYWLGRYTVCRLRALERL